MNISVQVVQVHFVLIRILIKIWLRLQICVCSCFSRKTGEFYSRGSMTKMLLLTKMLTLAKMITYHLSTYVYIKLGIKWYQSYFAIPTLNFKPSWVPVHNFQMASINMPPDFKEYEHWNEKTILFCCQHFNKKNEESFISDFSNYKFYFDR